MSAVQGPLSDASSYITPAAALIAEMRSQLTDYANNVYDQSFLAHFAYQYDALGRITQQTHNILGAGDVVQQYQYDDAGRLTQYKQGMAQTTWGYDANGNRTQENGSTIATYDSEDRLQSWKGNTYTYNAAGDLQSKTTTAADTTSYQYDALGNLRSVTLPNADQIQYLIDPTNRRIGKKKNGVLQYGLLYQDSLRPIAQLKPDGTIRAVFIYAEKANVPSAMLMDDELYRIISDHLGSVRLVINASTNTIVQQMDYDIWGNVTTDTNPEFQPFGFAGGLYDRDTGLTRFGARDYDAETGRWTAKDPILFNGGDTNLYGYVLQDPVNGVDPEGLMCFNFSQFTNQIERNRANNWLTLGSLVSDLTVGTMPKTNAELRSLGQTKAEINPFTSQLSRWSGRFGSRGLRLVGRTIGSIFAGAVATGSVVFEGFYDWGVILKSGWNATNFDDCGCGN